jgi:predicted flap endonuclease-1-like 5' DNA nuclease
MPTPTYTTAILICLGALAMGLLIGWAHFRLRTAADFILRATHREELVAMRQRYRRRLRAVRDGMLRHKVNEEHLRSELRVAADHNATHARLMSAAQAEISMLRDRIGTLNGELNAREHSIGELRAREQSLAGVLREAVERIAAFERDHGLLRIERDELVARTERLRAISLPDPAALESPVDDAPAAPGANAPRAELADRDARIHELQCELRESEARMTELESSLNTWKYRIAPLALHMKIQRDRARQAQSANAAASGGRVADAGGADDLQRIHGIGRALEKKLGAEGISRIAQLAGMSPAELANLAVRVGVAASRPQRDRWAEQARTLCEPAGDAPAVTGDPPAARIETA